MEITKVGEFDDGGEAFDVVVSEPYAYVADGTDGLEIIDISTPSSPFKIGQFNDGGEAFDVVVSGPYAYVADGEDGLEILQGTMQNDSITVTNPTNSSTWTKGTLYNITWDHTGLFSHVKIELYESSSLALTLTDRIYNDGSYTWIVKMNLTAGTNYRMKVTSTNDSKVYDYSDYFEIEDEKGISGFLVVSVALALAIVVGVRVRRKKIRDFKGH
ncbi:MAG: Ser-Thr-rich GPI-anchored membrane family protein [Candidatus Hermodarchaeota archaeon]